jgi:hypothetical protein
VWLGLPMWTRCKNCDSCQIAPATVETETGFFLCDKCEAVVIVVFEEFELSEALPIGD